MPSGRSAMRRACAAVRPSTEWRRCSRSRILTFNAPLKGVRAIVDATLPDGQSAELRMFLRARNRTLSETWTATWSVPPGDAAGPQSPKN